MLLSYLSSNYCIIDLFLFKVKISNQGRNMSNLINLSCPSCGASLTASKDLLRLTCPYCGKESVFKSNDGKTLELHSQCPICHRNDRVAKVSSIIASGSDNRAFFAPPIKPVMPKEISFDPPPYPPRQIAKSKTGLPAVLMILSALIFLLNLLSSFGNKDNSGSITAAIIFAIIGVASYFWWRNSKKQYFESAKDFKNNVENYQVKLQEYNESLEIQKSEQKAQFEKWVNNWESAMNRWRLLYYCNRDDCVFIPGEDESAPLQEMLKFIYHSK